MYEEIKLKHLHPVLQIGVQDIRNAWLLAPVPVKLTTTIHRGTLVFRLPVSGKRISYKTLKKGLVKKTIIIKQPLYVLPF
ncbi:MAG: hypothetical protein JNK14_06020 [Chitinophagaceae bacterium]|nr:hypothetical protein [Chitinophagaceae bacterium]